MKSLSRDTKLVIGILVLLVTVTVLAALQKQTQQQYPALSTISSAPNGALAFKLWVQDLHYNVDEAVLENFIPPQNASILFVLEPLFPAEEEVQAIEEWVKEGGTLIAIGEQYGMYSLAGHFDFEFSYLADPSAEATIETPLVESPVCPCTG